MKLIPREKDPDNLESPRSIFDHFLTPQDLFYVRNHFDTPEIARGSWQLLVEGEVQRRLALTLEDLLRMPSERILVTLECAGNSRALLDEDTQGVQWELGAVGTAEWTGVPLAAVLDQAEIAPGAVDIILEGADRGSIEKEPKSPGEIPFARSLPLAKARQRDTLLAYQMNGRDLPTQHGFPLRAIVPGWYGMASVKWLQRIIVSANSFHGYFQTLEYSHWNDTAGIPSLAPLSGGEVKAEIAFPKPGQTVPADSVCLVHGAAWAGEFSVSRVEISVDDGATWVVAKLIDPARPYCWTRWQYEWRTPDRSCGTVLLARAIDSEGRAQPWSHDKRERAYSIHHVLPVKVHVRT